jgi:hypothetical protein
MKTELEQAAEIILFENTKNVEIRYRGGRDSVIKSMLDMAKWQQEQDKKLYSETDMTGYALYVLKNDKVISPKEWKETIKQD